jgi:aspartyl/asparaginyl beta-hydroxylase (cupin superfamily)
LTVLIVVAAIVGVAFGIYFVEPFLYAFLFSRLVELFVKNPPYLPVAGVFPEGKILRDNWTVIQAELHEILKDVESIPRFHEVDRLQRFISARDDVAWRTFFLKGFDKWLPGNCERVPKTAALLRELPMVTTAMFSIIDGGKHIPPHVGFFKSVLRYHLGLIVPTDAPVYIVVGGEQYHWREGEDVLFDDTYLHEVWNKSSERRAVLFCDVLRDSTLPPIFRGVNRLMFRVLRGSRKLRAAARRAEVARSFPPAP